MKKFSVECMCWSKEHQVEFVLWDEEDPELYLNVHIATWFPWYRRLWHMVKYVFGYRCKYGDFDGTTFSKEEAQKLIDICNQYLEVAE